MKRKLSFLQVAGIMFLMIGLFVGYRNIDIFSVVGYNPDFISGFLFWFVSVPADFLGIMMLLIDQIMKLRSSKNVDVARNK